MTALVGLRIALTHVYAWPEVRRGGERYLHELGAALHRRGHHVTIWTTALHPSTDVILDVPVRYLRRRHLLPKRLGAASDEAAFGLQLIARLLPRRVDAWHAFGTSDAAAAALMSMARSTTSVYTDLGVPAGASRRRRPDRRVHQVVVDRIDHYLCLSETAAGYLHRDFGRQGTVVGGGVDLRRFAPADRRSPSPSLLFAGALEEPRKNLPLLLRAAALLRSERPDLEIWLSGPGDPRAALDAVPEATPAVRVRGLGTPEELGRLYGEAWTTVLPSENEAFGLVLVESLACGTPVVSLAEGGPSEIVRPGVGFTADATPESLAAACSRSLDLVVDPSIVERCRSVAEGYDWVDAIAPRLEALYA